MTAKQRKGLSIVKHEREITFGRTDLGQTIYDVLHSSLSAAEVARRHSGDLNRELVLYLRHKYRDLRWRA